MSTTTKIEWTDYTWSPLRVRVKPDAAKIAKAKGYKSLIQIAEKMAGHVGPHCEHVSHGCDGCYAETNNHRCLPANGTGLPYDRRSRDLVDPFVDKKILSQPLKWREPRRIFPMNQTDLFGDWWTTGQIAQVWDVMRDSTRHTYQILTKRTARAIDLLSPLTPLAHIHVGFSAENQDVFDSRWGMMARLSAAGWMVWCSYEPALGPIDMTRALNGQYGRLSWVVVGGESGPGARPAHPQWFRNTRDQCIAAGVPFFFKQHGAWVSVSELAGAGKHYTFPDGATVRRVGKKAAGAVLDGKEWKQFPDVK